MTSSPSEAVNGEAEAADAGTDADTETAAPEPHPLQGYADDVATAVGGEGAVVFDTVKVEVDSGDWVSALTTARDEMGLISFSWLSATDWSSEVEVGDPYPEAVEDRIELLHARIRAKFDKVPIRTSWLVPRNDDGPALCRVTEPLQRLAA